MLQPEPGFSVHFELRGVDRCSRPGTDLRPARMGAEFRAGFRASMLCVALVLVSMRELEPGAAEPNMVPVPVNVSTCAFLLKLCNVTVDHCLAPLLGLTVAEALAPEADSGAVDKKPSRVGLLEVPLPVVCSVVVVAVVVALVVWRRRVLHLRSLPHRDEILKIKGSLGKPTLFSYNTLKAATKGFHISNKIGEGGFGAVYKGVLQDGSEVAVKQLSAKSRQGEEEFLNEVTLLTKVRHKNLLKIRGCCIKGRERLLVYELLENRSLHQALFADPGKRLHLDWKSRVKILLGTARGLAYLHEGCQTRIVHRDIKSSNILLDKDLNAKVADFGLAYLFPEDQSHISTRVAGTIGYLAPEYALRGQLTEKADVFSFGIVALELVSGRTNFNVTLPTEEAYLLDWTWMLHEEGSVLTILDPLVVVEAINSEEVIRVIEIALLCTQSVASMRPSMVRVVSMLAGEVQVEARNVVKPTFHTFSPSFGRLPSMESPFRNPNSQHDASAITVVIPR